MQYLIFLVSVLFDVFVKTTYFNFNLFQIKYLIFLVILILIHFILNYLFKFYFINYL